MKKSGYRVLSLLLCAVMLLGLMPVSTFAEEPAEEHTHVLTIHEAVAATTEAAGSSEYYSCDCGKYFSDAKGTQEIKAGSWVIPQLPAPEPEPEAQPEAEAEPEAEASDKTFFASGTGTPIGTVRVIVENNTYPMASGAPWDGELVNTLVDLYPDSTMMSCVVAALESEGYEQKGAENNYISSIAGLGAFDGGGMSGWMGTLNDWFTNYGFGDFKVSEKTLAAGDIINIMYTCDYGEDLGGSWSNTDTSVKAVSFSAGTLNTPFSKSTYSYTLTLPEGVTSVYVTPTASNKNYQVRNFVSSTEYKRTVSIPVEEGTVIRVRCGDPSWPSMNEPGEATEYSFTIAYPVKVPVTVSAPNAASMAMFAETDTAMKTNLLDGSGNASVVESNYKLCLYDESSVCLGSIVLPVSENNADFTVLAVSVACGNAGWVLGTDYTVGDIHAISGGGEASVPREIELGATGNTFLCLSGDKVSARLIPSADQKAAGYAPADAVNSSGSNVVTGAGYATLTGTCEQAGILSVTYPYADTDNDGVNDFILEAGQMKDYFVYSYLEAEQDAEPQGETITEEFTGLSTGNYFYRVTNPTNNDAVTYGSYTDVKVGTNPVTVTKAQMHIGDSIDSNTIVTNFSKNNYDVADLYLSVSGDLYGSTVGYDGAAGQLSMTNGQAVTLYPFRNWLAVESFLNSKVTEPDFHVQVVNVSGSPVTVTENTENNSSKHSYQISAVGKGTAVLLVTYDAMTHDVTDGMGGFFSAIWPKNTGVIVVTVDETGGISKGMTINETLNLTEANKMAVEKYDAELDVIYYIGNEGASYSFKPEDGTTVTVAKGVQSGAIGFSADGVSTAADGTVTITGLPEGKSIVKFENGGRVSYQVIRAEKTDVTITDGAGNVYMDTAKGELNTYMKFAPGDTVNVSYSDLYHPANKFSGFYNMNAKLWIMSGDTKIAEGTKNQYMFASTAAAHKAEFTIPADAVGSYVFGGTINASGYGSYYGYHRVLTYEVGKAANMSAVQQNGYMGSLPVISLPVVKSVPVTVSVMDPDGQAVSDYEIALTDANSAAVTLTDGVFNGYPGKTYSYVLTVAGYPRMMESVLIPADQTDAYTLTLKLTDFAEGSWNGTALTEPAQTAEGVYQIGTGAELAWFASKVNDGTVSSANAILTADIELSGMDWTPIGTNTNKYTGTFDGDGYYITGLYINSSSTYQGLFGYVSDGTIRNLGAKGQVKGGQYTAGIVAYLAGSGSVDCCMNAVNVTGGKNCGGIAGFQNTSAPITNCYNTGSITAGNVQLVGGISGGGSTFTQANTITNCYNIGTVYSTGKYGGAINGSNTVTKVTNSYYLEGSWTGTQTANVNKAGTARTAEQLKGLASTLGDAWLADETGLNNGYPILAWQKHVHTDANYDGVCDRCKETFATVASASVNYTAQAAGAFLTVPAKDVTVSANLAELYGFEDGVSYLESVSALDVLVKAHQAIFGDAFTKETVGDYLVVPSTGFITKLFGTGTSYCSFALNGGCPNDGTASTYGGYNGTTVTTTAVSAGDMVEFFIYQDDEMSLDNYAYVTAPERAAAGSEFTVNVSGVCYGWYGYMYLTPSDMKAAAEPLEGISLATVNMETGALTDLEVETDDDGNVSLKFDETGTYVLVAYGTDITDTPVIMSLTSIEILAPGFLSDLTFGSGSAATNKGNYTLSPAFDPLVHEYTLYVNDTATAMYAWATLSAEGTGSTIKAYYVNTSGTSKNVTLTSAKATGASLASCVKKGSGGNSVEITVGTQTYTVNIVRTATLKSLAFTLDGEALTIAPAFAAATCSYNVLLNEKPEKLGVTAAVTTEGAVITAKGEALGDVIDIEWDGNEGKATLDVSFGDEASTCEYTLNVFVNTLKGSGTEKDPHQIKNIDDMCTFRDYVNLGFGFSGEYFSLKSDITLPTGWETIGDLSDSGKASFVDFTSSVKYDQLVTFKGIFDGNGHTITVPEGELTAFGAVNGATLKNFNIYGPKIPGYGVVQYWLNGSGKMSVTIENVKLLSGTRTMMSGFIGGYASGSDRIVIRNCEVEEGVSIGNDGSGFWAGYENLEALPSTAYAYGPTAPLYQNDFVGSFIGAGSGEIINCKSSATVYGHNYVGGIWGFKGQSMGDCFVRECYFNGSVIATGNYAGGILGCGYASPSAPNTPCATVQNCVCYGSVSGADYVGGITSGEITLGQAWNNGLGYIQNNFFGGTIACTGEHKAAIISCIHTIDSCNIISNNYYLTGCGVDKGVIIDAADTSEKYMRNDGVFAGDDPESFSKAVSSEAEVLDALNAGANSSTTWTISGGKLVCGTERHIVSLSSIDNLNSSSIKKLTSFNQYDNAVITVTYNDGSIETIKVSDCEKVGWVFLDTGYRPVQLIYKNAQLVFVLQNTDIVKDPAAAAVDDAFVALGAITPDVEAELIAILEAYNALTDDQKAQVENVEAIMEAAGTLAEMKAVAEQAISFALDRDYLLLTVGGSDAIHAELTPAIWNKSYAPVWTVENADGGVLDIITIDPEGNITAVSAGTAYAMASVNVDGQQFVARCRVDVAEEPKSSEVTSVSLVDTAKTVQLYSSDYTSFDVLLEREALVNLLSMQPVDKDQLPAEEDNTAAIESAYFTNEKVKDLFSLVVEDDNTIRIVPDYDAAILASLANSKAVASKYKSTVTVIVDGKEFVTGTLTLTVKKTMPKVTAKALSFNTLIPLQEKAISFTGGKVTKVELNESASTAAKWLDVREDGTAALKPDVSGKKSGSLKLTLTLDGWAVKPVVTVKASSAATAPKLTFKPASLTLKAKVNDSAATKYTISSALFNDFPVSVSRIVEGKKTYDNGNYLYCDIEDGNVAVFVNNAPEDGKAHTYKVYLSIAGKEYPFTVKVLAAATKVTLTAKATGAIDTSIEKSPVKLALTFKNYHAGNGETVDVKIIRAATKTEPEIDVTDLFDIEEIGTGYMLTEKTMGSLAKGYTYNAIVSADLNGTTVTAKPVKLTVKWSDPSKVLPSFTLKATGSIDVLRGGTSITLKPVVKNCYVYALSADDLTFYTGSGKSLTELADAPFEVEVKDGAYVITAIPGCSSAVKYSVVSKLDLCGTQCTSGNGKVTALSVKMGKASGKADRKSVTLLSKDRYDDEEITISLTDKTLKGIARVELNAAVQNRFDLERVSDNIWAIGWKGNSVSGKKAATVKLGVFLEGNETTKANFTISVKVNVK